MDVPSAPLLDVDHCHIGYRSKRSGRFTLACDDLSFRVEKNEFIAVVGPSGCGKTTFLLAVAGLIDVAEGALRLGGERIAGPGRDRSLVFQQASLFPWRTVRANVRFGLQAQGRLDAAGAARVESLLELVGLADKAEQHPGELSGGMSQRVNLARALATDPALLLLDEPFASLDAQTREVMQEELLRIWQSDGVTEGKTAVFITHDVAEAVFLADRVVVFSAAPGHVAEIVDIDLPRPRTPALKRAPELQRQTEHILEAIMHPRSAREEAADDDRAALQGG